MNRRTEHSPRLPLYLAAALALCLSLLVSACVTVPRTVDVLDHTGMTGEDMGEHGGDEHGEDEDDESMDDESMDDDAAEE